jgi:hypothetical protein
MILCVIRLLDDPMDKPFVTLLRFIYSYEHTGLNSMDVRDICPYTRGTPAHRLLSRKEIQSF